jgi:hypothetical protein
MLPSPSLVPKRERSPVVLMLVTIALIVTTLTG